ncbi:MAG: hypothetical protein ACR2G4_04745 [Pyrinomonadaceae bacterium]
MQDTERKNPAATETQTAARQDEATSGDTLSNLQDSQTDAPAPQSGTTGDASTNATPAPDGTPDTANGYHGDVRDKSGPM